MRSTADALSWALDRLLRNPDVHERLREEVRSNGEDYVDAVTKETLRARPPLGMCTRLVNKPYKVGEYELEPGTLIAPCIYLVHHDESTYPDPERFDPERFLGKKPGKYTDPVRGGYRSCVGGFFAMHEVKTVLRTLMQARFEAEHGRRRAHPPARVGMSPKDGVVAKLVERVPAAGVAAS